MAGSRDVNCSWLTQRLVPTGNRGGGGGAVDLRIRPPGRCPERDTPEDRGYHLPRRHVKGRRLGNQLYAARKLNGRVRLAGGLDPQTCRQLLNVSRAAIVHNLGIGGIRNDAGIRQRRQHLHQVVLGQAQGEEVLADHDIVVVGYASQGITVLAGQVFTA